MTDHFICGVQDCGCGTVILFQLDHFRIRIFFFKIQDIHDIRTPEFVDRLVIVTNYTQILILTGKKTYQLKLYRIRILILIHHDITESFLIILQHIRLCLKKLYRL